VVAPAEAEVVAVGAAEEAAVAVAAEAEVVAVGAEEEEEAAAALD
jgi:hypothetical protein